MAGQAARLLGAGRVVGIAGGPEKCRYVVERLGFDACVDYRAADFKNQLKDAVPEGVDKYFENVGGEVLDAALQLLNTGATVVLCGGISQYGNLEAVKGPSQYLKIAERNASMKGFTVDRSEPDHHFPCSHSSEVPFLPHPVFYVCVCVCVCVCVSTGTSVCLSVCLSVPASTPSRRKRMPYPGRTRTQALGQSNLRSAWGQRFHATAHASASSG